MRINKFVARATGMARRKADSIIASGQITINGKKPEVGQRVNDNDVVELAGKQLHLPTYKYLLLNKPVGYVCSRQSQRGMKTVYELLPANYRHLKLVGRLDKESSGAILLTDDGDFAHKMMHPSQGKSKIYEVELDKNLQDKHVEDVESGVMLEDGISAMKVLSHKNNQVKLELKEGRNRQIRRTFVPLGYEVIKLHRTDFGPYSLNEIKTGEFTEIEP